MNYKPSVYFKKLDVSGGSMWLVAYSNEKYHTATDTFEPVLVNLVDNVNDVSVTDNGQAWFLLNNGTLFLLEQSSESSPQGNLSSQSEGKKNSNWLYGCNGKIIFY